MKNDDTFTAKPNHDDIACHAYLLWKQAGSPTGQDLGFWLQAEAQLTHSVPMCAKPLLEAETKPKIATVQPSAPPTSNRGRSARSLPGSPKDAKNVLDRPLASAKKAEITKMAGAKGKSTSLNTRMSSSRPT